MKAQWSVIVKKGDHFEMWTSHPETKEAALQNIEESHKWDQDKADLFLLKDEPWEYA